MEHYIKFVRYGLAMSQTPKEFISHANPKIDEAMRKENEEIYDVALNQAAESKIFEISDEVKKLLCITDPPADLDSKLLRLPFPSIFLDVRFTPEDGIEDLWMEGVLVTEPQHLTVHMESKKDQVIHVEDLPDYVAKEWADTHIWRGYSLSQAEEGDNKIWINGHTWAVGEFPKDRFTIRVVRDKYKQHAFLRKFITNFILFLYQRDVEIKTVVRDYTANDRRRRQGKIPLPTSYKVELKGELKKYVSSLKNAGYFQGHYTHKFDVRGHFRTYNDERYINVRGQRKFIPAYVKGSGIYVPASYNLTGRNTSEIDRIKQEPEMYIPQTITRVGSESPNGWHNESKRHRDAYYKGKQNKFKNGH
jgi:hypothetical protein